VSKYACSAPSDPLAAFGERRTESRGWKGEGRKEKGEQRKVRSSSKNALSTFFSNVYLCD